MMTRDDLFALAFGARLDALPDPSPDEIRRAEELRAWLASRPATRPAANAIQPTPDDIRRGTEIRDWFRSRPICTRCRRRATTDGCPCGQHRPWSTR